MKATITIEAQAMLPILKAFQEYFDNKYPCTDESNDGTNMDAEDTMMYHTYDYLLNTYNKCADVYYEAYNECIEKIKKESND